MFILSPVDTYGLSLSVFPLDEAISCRAVFVIVYVSDRRTDGRAGGNALGANYITEKR